MGQTPGGPEESNLPTNNTVGQHYAGGTYNGSSYNLGVYFGRGAGNGCWAEPGGAGGLGGGGNGGLQDGNTFL